MDNDYFDQSHFIKDFKSFTGAAPADFIRSRQAMLQIMKTGRPDLS